MRRYEGMLKAAVQVDSISVEEQPKLIMAIMIMMMWRWWWWWSGDDDDNDKKCKIATQTDNAFMTIVMIMKLPNWKESSSYWVECYEIISYKTSNFQKFSAAHALSRFSKMIYYKGWDVFSGQFHLAKFHNENDMMMMIMC